MSTGNKRTFKDYLRIYATGFIMGAADVVPGVSGGTMAFILGIYQELIDSIHAFTTGSAIKTLCTLNFKKAFTTLPWPFLAALGGGIVSAILLLASYIKWMLENRPSLIWGFFFGLVLASIFAVWGRVAKWRLDRYAALLLGGVGAWVLVGLPFTNQPPEGLWYVALCGAIAICAMILPGISGSFMLVLLGKYDTVLSAVHHLKGAAKAMDFSAMLPHVVLLAVFIVGIVIGIASFVRIFGWLFRKYNDLTVAVLIGFMAGSLRKVWPWKAADGIGNVLPAHFDDSVMAAIGLALFGFALVIAMEKTAAVLEKKRK